MKTMLRDPISIATMIAAYLGLAGCSDPQDIPINTKRDSGVSNAGSGGSAVPSAGVGGSSSNSTGGNAVVIGSGGSGGASDLQPEAGSGSMDAAAPTPSKLGAVLFSADMEDGKTDSW